MIINNTIFFKQYKNIFNIAIITCLILMIPLLSMQFTDEVNWSSSDFVIAGGVLFTTGFIFDLAMRKVRNIKYKAIVGLVIVLAFLLIWTELAVGLFGTPFGGS